MTTAPSADLVLILVMTMATGAVPSSRVLWKKPDQPELPLADGKTRTLPVKAHPVQGVPGLDDPARGGVDAAPAGDGLGRDQGLALGVAGHYRPAVQGDHGSLPRQRPVTAASTQSSRVPNQASMPRMAGR